MFGQDPRDETDVAEMDSILPKWLFSNRNLSTSRSTIECARYSTSEEKYELESNMITTSDIACDFLSFLDKDQIERIQLVNHFWNNVIIRHKNILPLRQFFKLNFNQNLIRLSVTREDTRRRLISYVINFDGTNLSKGNVSSRYSQLTADEVLTNLNNVVYDSIEINGCDSERSLDNLLNLMKFVITKTGRRFRGTYGRWYARRFGSKLDEIFDNYIIVDELTLDHRLDYRPSDSYIREVCANPEIVQFPSTPKEIILRHLAFGEENDEVLHFTCNGKLNRANRLTIEFYVRDTNYDNFIQQWFELYRTHQNPISLVGKFEFEAYEYLAIQVFYAVKRFLNNTQLRVKYSLEEFHRSFRGVTYQYVKRHCVLHETDSYALVIEMTYRDVTDMSSINASDFDQLPFKKMQTISFCVKSL